MIIYQDLWLWQTAHFSHESESHSGFVFFPFIYLLFIDAGGQIVKWVSESVIFTKATETLPLESADLKQLGLEEEEMSCLNFFGEKCRFSDTKL